MVGLAVADRGADDVVCLMLCIPVLVAFFWGEAEVDILSIVGFCGDGSGVGLEPFPADGDGVGAGLEAVGAVFKRLAADFYL